MIRISLLVVLGLAWPAWAQTESVPASFDCAKASSVVEKIVCSQAVLRWQDLALSRSYRAARETLIDAARDELLANQRDWIRERDRRCIADRTFKELSRPSSALQRQSYACLNTVYLDHRRTLQDLADAPLSPRVIKTMDLRRIAAARPEIIEGGSLRVADVRLSPDGALAAILLPSLELDGPDQVWLYRARDGRLIAATPAPDLQEQHPPGSPIAIAATAWRGDTLYTRVVISSKDETETGTNVVYATTIEASTRLDNVPTDIRALLDAAMSPDPIAADEQLQDQMLRDQPNHLDPIQGNRDFLVWANDPGHGTISLYMRKRAAGSLPYLVAWGSWGLWRPLFDSHRSQIVYASDTGIMIFDLAQRTERRIAGTSRGDLPYSASRDFDVLVWSTRNACGNEYLTEPDPSEPEQFCFARLPIQPANP